MQVVTSVPATIVGVHKVLTLSEAVETHEVLQRQRHFQLTI
jgi:hypothetical protein